MAEFTKEQLREHLDMRLTHTRKAVQENTGTGWAEFYEKEVSVLEIALAALTAGMEQEPVAWVMKDDLADADIISTPAYPAFADAITKTIGELIPLYAAPQLPQPAVPGAISTRQAISKMEECDPCDSINVAYKYGWNACRAAMLQGAEPVQPYTLRDGWVAVPVEPTAAMYEAGDRQLATKQVWDAMIAAAPQQEVKP